ncbi:hypothetical protein AG1IA_06017 [Rhizoctonia solani AG-1 IA]|uniref:Uncharacterized protein n=1 Tax=Thanatephorus cucumeris (strain AG1-IA) TaxID=983506 RepID=L8WT75_THACA|nr:hypothetical protein AG1IA_06017 [Rhizoctonia solani AG-1 IA]
MGEMDALFGATYIGVVISTLLVDTIQSAFICHMQYHYTITNYANPEALQFNICRFYGNHHIYGSSILCATRMVLYAISAHRNLQNPNRPNCTVTKRVGSRFTTTRTTQFLGAVVVSSFVTHLPIPASCCYGLEIAEMLRWDGLACADGPWVRSWVIRNDICSWTVFTICRVPVARWNLARSCGALRYCHCVYAVNCAHDTTNRVRSVSPVRSEPYIRLVLIVTRRTDALINKLLRYTIHTGLLTRYAKVTVNMRRNSQHWRCSIIAVADLTLLATLNARDTEPTNVVHVEEGSYNLKERQQNASHPQIKFNRPPGMTSSQVTLTIRSLQDRGEPVIHLHTDTTIEVSNIEPRRRASRDQYQGRQVVVLQHGDKNAYNQNKDIEFDADGADSVDSFGKGRS